VGALDPTGTAAERMRRGDELTKHEQDHGNAERVHSTLRVSSNDANVSAQA